MGCYINPYLFFLIREGVVIAWDYKNHNQFKLSLPYFCELIYIAQHVNFQNLNIFNDLLEGGLILEESPFPMNWGWDELSKIFHIGTNDVGLDLNPDENYVQQYAEYCHTNKDIIDSLHSSVTIESPHFPILENTSFYQVLMARTTSRKFTFEKIPLLTIKELFRITFGIMPSTNCEDALGKKLIKIGVKKTSPSAGNLHSSEAYLLSFNIESLSRGIYYYDSTEDKFILKNECNLQSQLTQLLNGQHFAEKLSAGIMITSKFNKIWNKYHHSRAYRVALLDIGHLSQTFLLSATAYGLLTWMTAIFEDSQFEKFLDLEEYEKPLLFLGLGTGQPCPIDEDLNSYLHNMSQKEKM
jgi:SagB-type dehydrogenase family enzyme